ncbi:pyridoxal phosphate-dependent aminotransferase family protein [uncultured Polaribacter sp.]|uniref:aminotransferase class I/II-fold pyridoxal phosphate-dependent enzyme n=1 Tax=uncultured Polaribacter sp. TaxID=174711 RepID=UPI002609EA68|nr:pyridoxal phosphate-dependent aminotransferase family protein [uncultured Polaribacter sp.]
MKKLSDKNSEKLQQRVLKNAIRVLGNQSSLIDFSSNDYLGFAKSETIFHRIHQFLIDNNIKQNGATGSRLISGNHILYSKVEGFLSNFHESESATIFNSGYDANIGFFSSVPQRGDVILYDEFIHASIRDGIQLSNAKSFKFSHNDLENLEERILHFINNENSDIYVVTESVFSMDGDSPDLVKASEICKKHNAFLIIDEAHAIGVFGKNGCGLIQQLNIQNQVFARIITFGKALGCHGAAILGSQDLQNYLINFARSFIYTTGLSPHSLATIQMTYNEMINESSSFDQNHILNSNIDYFLKEIKRLNLNFIASHSTIHCCVISGNKKVKLIAEKIQKNGFGVKAILSPTVPENKERLRFCLHSYNSKQEISEVLELLSNFVK